MSDRTKYRPTYFSDLTDTIHWRYVSTRRADTGDAPRDRRLKKRGMFLHVDAVTLCSRERVIMNGESRGCIEMRPSRREVLQPLYALQIAHSTNDPRISIACLRKMHRDAPKSIETFRIDLGI